MKSFLGKYKNLRDESTQYGTTTNEIISVSERAIDIESSKKKKRAESSSSSENVKRK